MPPQTLNETTTQEQDLKITTTKTSPFSALVNNTLEFLKGEQKLWAPGEGEACLEDYYGLKFSKELATSYITDGYDYLQQLYKDGKIVAHTQHQKERFALLEKEFSLSIYLHEEDQKLDTVLAICWALYCVAYDHNFAYGSGAMIIEDPKNALWGLFQEFNKKNESSLRLNKHLPTINSRSYSRSSSHLTHLYGDYGLDVRFSLNTLTGGYCNPLALLPTNATHLLYKKIPATKEAPDQLFIKFEPYGFYWKSFLAHGYQFVQSATGFLKRSAFERREKMPDLIQQRIATILKSLKPLNFIEKEDNESLISHQSSLGMFRPRLKALVEKIQKKETNQPQEKAAIEGFLSDAKAFESLLGQYLTPSQLEQMSLYQWATEVILTQKMFIESQEKKK